MNHWYQLALQKLGFRQQAYRATFGEGAPGHMVLVDLANFCGAYDADLNGMTHDEIMVRHGRRQVFFRILKHIKLSPDELEVVSRSALLQAAARLQQINKGDE